MPNAQLSALIIWYFLRKLWQNFPSNIPSKRISQERGGIRFSSFFFACTPNYVRSPGAPINHPDQKINKYLCYFSFSTRPYLGIVRRPYQRTRKSNWKIGRNEQRPIQWITIKWESNRCVRKIRIHKHWTHSHYTRCSTESNVVPSLLLLFTFFKHNSYSSSARLLFIASSS